MIATLLERHTATNEALTGIGQGLGTVIVALTIACSRRHDGTARRSDRQRHGRAMSGLFVLSGGCEEARYSLLQACVVGSRSGRCAAQPLPLRAEKEVD